MRFHRGVHTVHNSGGFRMNEISGNPISRHRTKEAAVRQGRRIAMKWKNEHEIHNLNGEIRRQSSHGHDPRPSEVLAEKNR